MTMRRHLSLGRKVVIGVATIVSGCAHAESKALSLCALQDAAKTESHEEVVVSGQYTAGVENTFLRDEHCPLEATWVDFELRDPGDRMKLLQVLGKNRLATVVFEGEFFGPPAPDPSLPEPLRDHVQSRWGHLGCCRTKLVVHAIREARHASESERF